MLIATQKKIDRAKNMFFSKAYFDSGPRII